MNKKYSLEKIYILYADDLYQYLFSMCKNINLAEDIMQETFYRAYFFLDNYQEEAIKPWLFKVAYHTFIDQIRKDKRLVLFDHNLLSSKEILNHIKSAEDEYLNQEAKEIWITAVNALPFKKRQALLLKSYYQFSYLEIADILGLTLAQVKITIYRARKEIQHLTGGMHHGL